MVKSVLREAIIIGYYHIAQICLNGHVITDHYDSSPEFRQNFCDICGSKTITKCPNCGSDIRGDYEVEGVAFIGSSMTPAPAYCYNCGKPLPWTSERLKVAHELLELDSTLSNDDKNELSNNMEYLLSETPRTQISAMKFKRFLNKVGSTTANSIKDILVDIASETAKKIIWPD